MIRLFAVLSLLILGAPAAAAPVYVHAGVVIDPATGKTLVDQRIEIEGDRVAAIGRWTAPPPGARIIDWSTLTVLPGLIDLHTHLADYTSSPNVDEPLKHDAAETALVGAKNAHDTLMAGFTTVRDVGVYRAFSDVTLHRAIEAGLIPGPRMAVAGAYLTIPGGGGEINGLAPGRVPADMRFGVVRTPAEATAKARALFAGGADFLKLIATGAVLAIGTEPGSPELTETEMHAAVTEAKRHGSYATAHAHGAAGIKAAMAAGVRSIEHASLIDDAGIAMAKARGVWLVMDVYNGDYIDDAGTREGWPAEYLRKNRETTEAQRAGFRKAVAAGVKIGFGTDAGVYPHGLNARQFAFMVRYGMTPMAAIRSATSDAASLMGRRDVGLIAPGRFADMIAVEGDVLADIARLEHVAHVMKGGVAIR